MATLPPPSIERPTVRIATTNGRVDVIAEDRTDIDVRGDAEVRSIGAWTTVTGGNDRLTVRIPLGADIVIGTTSGRVDVSGSVGATAITTESGRVAIGRATSVDVRSANGRIEVEDCSQQCRVRSEHGAVVVGSCGSADVATTNGKIALRDVRGVVRAHCTNGRVDITMATADDVTAETVTGRVNVSLPRGVRAFRADLADGQSVRQGDADCVVSTHSVTGRVEVVNR
jgi:DUF4097 and DUF4098 domain-containing protein YvlB